MIKLIPTLTIVFALLFTIAGTNHFIKPQTYLPFIHNSLPKLTIIYLSGIVEVLLGIGLLVPAYKSAAAMGIFLLMIVFLPLHIVDVFKQNPAIGSKTLAYIRLPLQFVLIYLAWLIKKN